MSGLRYLKSIGGNASVSAASLANTASVFSIYSMEDFGFYSLALIFSTLTFSVVNSLFVASMQDYVTNDGLRDCELAAFTLSNVVAILAMALLFSGYTYHIFEESALTLSVFIFMVSSSVRWMVKSYHQMISDVNGYVVSDALLALGLFVLSAIILGTNVGFVTYFWLLSAVQVCSLLSLKTSVLAKSFVVFRFDTLNIIKEGFKLRGKDALIGTFTLELSQNSHSYLISLFAGPQAFAPIALANLVFRPFAVVMAGLVQSERPLFSKLLFEKKISDVRHACSKLQRIVLFCLVINFFIAVAAIYLFDKQIVEKVGQFDSFQLILSIMVLICLFRTFRFPIALFFQSLGDYGAIKRAVFASGLVSVVTVLLFLFWGWVQASIIGLLLGEIVMFVYLKRLSMRLSYET